MKHYNCNGNYIEQTNILKRITNKRLSVRGGEGRGAQRELADQGCLALVCVRTHLFSLVVTTIVIW